MLACSLRLQMTAGAWVGVHALLALLEPMAASVQPANPFREDFGHKHEP